MLTRCGEKQENLFQPYDYYTVTASGNPVKTDVDEERDSYFSENHCIVSEKDILTQKYTGNTFATEMIFVVFKALIADWKEKFTPPE